MKKALAQILIGALMMGGSEPKYDNRPPVKRQTLSKPATMSKKAWKKHKQRLKMTKASRKANYVR